MANKQVEISMAEWDVMNIIWDKKSVSANEIDRKSTRLNSSH